MITWVVTLMIKTRISWYRNHVINVICHLTSTLFHSLIPSIGHRVLTSWMLVQKGSGIIHAAFVDKPGTLLIVVLLHLLHSDAPVTRLGLKPMHTTEWEMTHALWECLIQVDLDEHMIIEVVLIHKG